MLPPYIDAVDKTGRTGQARDDTEDAKVTTTPVSKGIVLGPDGKPYVMMLETVPIKTTSEDD